MLPRSHFVREAALPEIIGITKAGNQLHVESIALMRWSQTTIANSGVVDHTIHPNRMVYQVTTSFETYYAVRGNHWSSGHRIFIVDAQSPVVLMSATNGKQSLAP